MNTDIIGRTGATATVRTFSNRHHRRDYPAGTAVEVIGTAGGDWLTCRVVGTRSIKGYVRASEIVPA